MRIKRNRLSSLMAQGCPPNEKFECGSCKRKQRARDMLGYATYDYVGEGYYYADDFVYRCKKCPNDGKTNRQLREEHGLIDTDKIIVLNLRKKNYYRP